MTERHVSTDSIHGQKQGEEWATQVVFEELGKLVRTKHSEGAVMVPFTGNVQGIS